MSLELRKPQGGLDLNGSKGEAFSSTPHFSLLTDKLLFIFFPVLYNNAN